MPQPVARSVQPPPFAGATVGLAVGVAAAVVLACAGGAYLYSRHHMQSLLGMARTTALSEGNLIRVALEHEMLANDRTLVAGMIDSFRRQSRVERLVVLDRTGVERYPSGNGAPDADLQLGSPTCQACHRYPAELRGNSRVIETRRGQVLRTVIPIRNRAECYGCHDPGHKINGILILDYRTDQLSEAMSHDLRWMVGGTAAISLLLVGTIGLVIRLAVLRRLQRFETAARKIVAGDLGSACPPAAATPLAGWPANSTPWPIPSPGWWARCATSGSGWRR